VSRRRVAVLVVLAVALAGAGLAWWWLREDPERATDLVRRVLPPPHTRREAILERHPEAMGLAAAVLEPVAGSRVRGTATFADLGEGRGVRIDVQLRGLSPGLHGLHLHDGSCDAQDAPDWDPDGGRRHAAPQVEAAHAGDLGNVVADPAGSVTVTLHSNRFGVGLGRASVIGLSLAVHADADDMVTQPHGSAGPPVACGRVTNR